MDVESISEIVTVICISLIMWYFISKYLLSTGISSRNDETMPIFIGGIALFVIVTVIIYLIMRLWYV